VYSTQLGNRWKYGIFIGGAPSTRKIFSVNPGARDFLPKKKKNPGTQDFSHMAPPH